MSASGTIDGIQYKQSKAGKAYAKVSINGAEYLVFGKTLDSLRRTTEGAPVEFSAKPSDNGDGQILTFLKATGNGATTGMPPTQTIKPRSWSDTKGRGNDATIQLSIFYGYAKDLVSNGVLKPAVSNPSSVADLISTIASELSRRFAQDSMAKEDAPAQDITVETNPL